jgi:pyruvate,orthophosphate dikinase
VAKLFDLWRTLGQRTAMSKYVYTFGVGEAEATGRDVDGERTLLGGKGAGLVEMSRLGIPVPPGFTITTEVCTHFYNNGRAFPSGLEAQVKAGLRHIERSLGDVHFGDEKIPLLVSVRSGARASMPGMMDTVLNLGMNDRTCAALAQKTKNPRFAWDTYRRFVQMYGDVVLGMKPEGRDEHDPFELLLERKKASRGIELDTEFTVEDLEDLVAAFKAEVKRHRGIEFPEDPEVQLWNAVAAVFNSWENSRAVTYRRMYNIPAEWGTAVTVQAMVFGNLGDDCATGVAFTRDPATGERRFFGEFLVNAQGEDVVAGTRTPQPITGSEMGGRTSLEERMPTAYAELERTYQLLEKYFRDMQDIEFTIQSGKLWMLQTRTGKRTAKAMIRIAVEMVREGLIDEKEAVLRMEPLKLEELLHPMLDPSAERRIIAKGLPASPGAAVGKVVFHADDAEAWTARGEKVVLVRIETSPEDIHGMTAAEGVLTARGGMTSHAAVVARGMGKCCVAGSSALHIDYAAQQFSVETPSGSVVVRRGDVISLDGGRGEVLLGAVPLTVPALDEDYRTLMRWVDSARRLKVRTNADTPIDAKTARNYGAEGIGLCRTEHMFFGEDKISAVRQMILAESEAARRRALEKILPMQRADFAGIFRAMDGFTVTIRLLDPPLHEFLPTEEAQLALLAKELELSVAEVRARAASLHEENPMLGHRGCRLGITSPEIYETQVQALIEAACEVSREGIEVHPEIMIPLISHERELERLRALVIRIADAILQREKVALAYSVGTMIELPRACLIADRLAKVAEFFSFGTNDLTQTTLGLSRDDASRFLNEYLRLGVYPADPFVAVDREGLGQLIELGVKKGRAARPSLKIGICGEHGGEPSTIAFCHDLGFDYVSCSPFRVPIARLAAAQAALRAGAAQKVGLRTTTVQ